MGSEQRLAVSPGTPGGLSAEPNGRAIHANPNLAGLPEDPKTREQILRERYLKGLKKRKCTVCGNTARARCPFRSCKTCCTRARNACSVHVIKPNNKGKPEGTIVHPTFNAPSSASAEQPWMGQSMQASMGSGYLRPGYSVPSPYNIPTPMGMGIVSPVSAEAAAAAAKSLTTPGARPWVANTVMDQQELQRLKSLRIAAQKEAIMANTWRLQKLKEHAAAEVSAEDDAFDRYMTNASLLEEVFTLNSGPLKGLTLDGRLLMNETGKSAEEGGCTIDESSLLDAMRVKLGTNSKRKDLSRRSLKQVVNKALLKLRRTRQESVAPELTGEDDETIHPPSAAAAAVASVPRWDSKRFKAQTEEGKQCLKRIEAFDMLLQKLYLIKNPDGVQACVDSYKTSLGRDLSYLLPHLCPSEELSSPHAEMEAVDAPARAQPGDNPASQAVSANELLNNGNEEGTSGTATIPADGAGPAALKLEERPWGGGFENLERLYWHRKYVRGLGFWKVHASEDTIHSMCADIDKTSVSLQQL